MPVVVVPPVPVVPLVVAAPPGCQTALLSAHEMGLGTGR